MFNVDLNGKDTNNDVYKSTLDQERSNICDTEEIVKIVLFVASRQRAE